MIDTPQKFADATAFERAVLATVYPLVNRAAPGGGYDLRTNRITLALSDDIGTRGRAELIHELRPLMFGAAWKVLDLLVELGLNQVRPRPEWRIADKQAQAGGAAYPPLDGELAIWSRIALVYANTVEQRHCLVHRSFAMTHAGTMTQMVDRGGRPVPDLTVTDQDAFCRLAQRVAMLAMANQCAPREKLDLIASVDALTSHHVQPVLGGGAQESLPLRIHVAANHLRERRWIVNTREAWDQANAVFPGRPYFDIEISFAGSGVPPVVGRLEDAPHEVALELDLANPPSWLEP